MTPSATSALPRRLDRPRLAHIDSLRGIAILMVIACHTVAQFRPIPWRFSQLVATGWHGVQLFFIASTLTLLSSYDWEVRSKGRASWLLFYVRRFFRIAPAYYVAAVIYSLLRPSQLQSGGGILGFAFFLNSWMPFPRGQALVPGSWSISVEWAFYVIFPVVACCLTTFRASFLFLIASIGLAIGGNLASVEMLQGRLEPRQIEDFVYFSFWNQLPVFALANLVYHAWYRPRLDADGNPNPRRDRIGLAFVIMGLVILPYLTLPRSFGSTTPIVPAFFATAICLAGLCVCVAGDCPRWLVNPWLGRIGVVSFSAYLWHWLVLEYFLGTRFWTGLRALTGVPGIGAYFLALICVIAITYALAWVSYQLIELPGVACGRRVAAFVKRKKDLLRSKDRDSSATGALQIPIGESSS
jgi:peptidoglycan/LPS O-acetylase OafA/YrhL